MTVALCLLIAPFKGLADSQPAFLPLPKQSAIGSGRTEPAHAFAIAWNGYHDALLDRAGERFQRDIERQTGVEPRSGPSIRLSITCRAKDPGFSSLGAHEDYRLLVSAGQVRLTADGPTGVLRGLATLRQAVQVAGDGFSIPDLSIDDSPRFAWRGVMLDVARHFVPVDDVMRQLDAMERVKLNVLHLHLSDNEGFRVESLIFPKLQDRASDGYFYRQKDIRKLVSYAADRGIRLVPEFDLPGHSAALLRAYPELSPLPINLSSTPPPGGEAINPTLPLTYRFLDRLLGEMAALFPDRNFHIGGDEVSAREWLSNPAIPSFMAGHHLATKTALEGYFIGKMAKVLSRHRKSLMGWDEIAESAISKDAMVQAWRSSSAVAMIAARGNRIVVSSGYYLDLLLPSRAYYATDPLDPTAVGLPVDAVAAIRDTPLGQKIPDAMIRNPSLTLSRDEQSLILGGEMALWSELVSGEMLDGRLWPAAAALAERFWSTRDVRDPDDMYLRLAVIMGQLRISGLEDEANRLRMIDRLAPGDSQAIKTFIDLVSPTRNYSHNHAVRRRIKGETAGSQTLNHLADIASPDSFVAEKFRHDVNAYLHQRGSAKNLIEELTRWRDNHEGFLASAEGRPGLQEAVPVSATIADLATLGLDSIAALDGRSVLDPDWCERADKILGRELQAEQASATMIPALLLDQPPADLLIAIVPAIRMLIDAAKGDRCSSAASTPR